MATLNGDTERKKYSIYVLYINNKMASRGESEGCSVDDEADEESNVQDLLVPENMQMLAVGLSALVILSNIFYAALFDVNRALNQNMC